MTLRESTWAVLACAGLEAVSDILRELSVLVESLEGVVLLAGPVVDLGGVLRDTGMPALCLGLALEGVSPLGVLSRDFLDAEVLAVAPPAV